MFYNIYIMTMALRDPTHLYEGEISEGKRKVAKFVSDILQPPVVSIPLFIALSLGAENVPLTIAVCLFFSFVFPMVEIYAWAKYKGIEGDIPNKDDRFVPLMLGVISYVIGAIVLHLISAPAIVEVTMVAYAVNTFVLVFISRYWKISIHAIGLVGPIMALIYVYGPWCALLAVLIPLVMWSRYVLKKHTPAQLICGALLGLVLTSAVFALML